jgi:hypothetical protein
MDVRDWRKYLELEKSENTVYSYLSRVSSFYEWLDGIRRSKTTSAAIPSR